MKTALKLIFAIIVVIIIVLAGLAVTSNALVIATDTTEGTPGVDMAAVWTLSDGFEWIYPGSSHNAEGQTLHNIYLDDPDRPYDAAADIMEYTYNIRPNVVVTVNNAAAEKIFGGDIVSDIREYDWGQGYDRGVAVEQAMGDFNINYLAIPECILNGDIAFHFI